jgi:hypothetical protein
MSRKIVSVVLAVFALGVAAGTAQASSIAFIRAGDVYLVTPDGGREHRVTTGGHYTDVTQADDGTIFAHDGNIVYRMDRFGKPLADPAGTSAMNDLDVSPDGSKIVGWHVTGASNMGGVVVMDANGSRIGWDTAEGWYASWISNDLVLMSNGGGWLTTLSAGAPSMSYWLMVYKDEKVWRHYSSAITRGVDRLVVVIRELEPPYGPYQVAHAVVTNPPPRNSYDDTPRDQQPEVRCYEPVGEVEPQHPSFSPDGASIAWELPDGVVVKPAFDLGACAQPPGGFSIAGATSPDWGPADVPIAPPNIKDDKIDVPPPAACVVPKLKGKTLRAAKRSLVKAGCRLGVVRRAKSRRRRGTVIKQSPRPGTNRVGGAKVRVTLAKR